MIIFAGIAALGLWLFTVFRIDRLERRLAKAEELLREHFGVNLD